MNRDDRASEWIARINAQPDDPELRGELADWLNESERNEGAFVRASAVWHMLGTLEPLQERSSPAEQAVAQDRRGFISAHWQKIAASISIIVLPLAVWAVTKPASNGAARSEVLATSDTAIKHIRLGDGSEITLDAGTEVAIAFNGKVRLIKLRRGRAFFEVAHQPHRPFVVVSGEVSTHAVGTAFEVDYQHDGGGAKVLVSEGVVGITVDGARQNDSLRLMPGAEMTYRAGSFAVASVDPTLLRERLAWRSGFIEMDGRKLGDVLAEANRYSHTKIAVSHELTEERMTGRLRLNQPAELARVIEVALDARAEKRDGMIYISR